ncbi:MAG: 2-C-methyl-D-erythritol 4-phosphate cytidylyltransferase [Deltaproteobacteria bacterium]
MSMETLQETFQQKYKVSSQVFCSAIILAAGKGTRMEAKINKVYMEIAQKPIAARTLEVFEESPLINEIIVVINERDKHYYEEKIGGSFNPKIKAVVFGGKRRQDSVSNGLKQVSQQAEIVLVHDCARPLVTCDIIERSLAGAAEYGAVCVGMPVKDTIKIVGKDGFVSETLPRDILWSVQTPQAFKKELLVQAHNRAEALDIQATDDAMLVEMLGHRIKVIEGSYENIKITTPEDIAIAEAILKYREKEY